MNIQKVRLGDLITMGFKPKPKKYWDNLRSSLKEGYRPNSFDKGYIRITKFNNVVDGNHRLHILKQLHNDDYEIDVRVSRMTGSFFPFIIWWYNENVAKRFSKFPNDIANDFYTTETYEGNYELKKIKLRDLKEFNNLRRIGYIRKKRPVMLLEKSKINNLSKSLLTEGYKPHEYGFIKIDRTNQIIDGYKRIHILLKRYGNNFDLEVMSLKRVVKKRIKIKTFLIVFFIILTLIIIIT